jgi:hypothetical protein
MRKKGFQVQFIKKYQLEANNTIIYGDYMLHPLKKNHNPSLCIIVFMC